MRGRSTRGVSRWECCRGCTWTVPSITARSSVVAFLGTDRNVRSLSESDVRRYAMARTEVPPAPEGVKADRAVRNRAVEADLLALYRALNWAVRERNKTGRRLLQENPLFGVKLPKERNPLRPVMTHDEYLKRSWLRSRSVRC